MQGVRGSKTLPATAPRAASRSPRAPSRLRLPTCGVVMWRLAALGASSGGRGLHTAEVPTSRIAGGPRMSTFVEGQQRGSKSSRTRPHDTPPNSTTASVQWLAMQGFVRDDLLGFLDGIQEVRRWVHTKVIAGRARDLPETALRTASLHPTTPISAAPLTCAVVRGRGVRHGVVNRPRIDGKDGVAGSIPAGGSTTTPQLRRVERPGCWALGGPNPRLPETCQSDLCAV
jgi:hypothetical protein